MRQRMRNAITVKVDGMNLTTCTDIHVYVAQNGITYDYSGTAISIDDADTSLLKVVIPKSDAMNFKVGEAEVQIALTDASGSPRSHNPIRVKMGKLLKGEGYGS